MYISVCVHLHEEWSVNITNYYDSNVNWVACINMMLAFYTCNDAVFMWAEIDVRVFT